MPTTSVLYIASSPFAGAISVLGAAWFRAADKDALLGSGIEGLYTIPHFDGYAAVLVQLRATAKKPQREAIEEAWLAGAPETLARAFLDDN